MKFPHVVHYKLIKCSKFQCYGQKIPSVDDCRCQMNAHYLP